MQISRRNFTTGALSASLALQAPGRARAQASLFGEALAAIQAYADVHRRQFGLPGLTLALALPDGSHSVFNSGYADAEARVPVGADTLFQIGSISKSFVAPCSISSPGDGSCG